MEIKRALISVSDKNGIVKLSKYLQSIGCEIISTGGTKKVLEENSIKVTEIQDVTGNPEAFGGRMKTISFNIESALLFDREKDKIEAEKLGIMPIDLVICNLYPFEKVYKQNAKLDLLIENIDIGGPTMIRAAAKNYKYVSVVTDPNDYDNFISALQEDNNNLDFRYYLMRKAFEYTALYDILIANVMNKGFETDNLLLAFDKKKSMRYGENSHQVAHFYREKFVRNSLYDFDIIHGKELSFNNILDVNSALESIYSFKNIACCVVKHNNPCGLATASNTKTAFDLAWAGDPISAFGSIVAFNSLIDLNTVKFLRLDAEDKSKRKFIEVIIAPDFSDDALTYLMQHKNLRIIRYDVKNLPQNRDIRYLNGALLYQDKDNKLYNKMQLVTDTAWNFQEDFDLIIFGLNAIKMLKSNAIAIVRNVNGSFQLLGMGAGQPNRIISTKLAIQKAIENLAVDYHGDDLDTDFKKTFNGAILLSDAFFPFTDSIEYMEKFGIKKVIQPGGSIKDKRVIKSCNELNVSMIFTGIRHFKH